MAHPGGHPAGHPGGHPGAFPKGHPGPGDNTSSARRSYRPGAGAAAKAYEERTGIKAPRIIAWEITRRCNLYCAHCRASAECDAYPGELTLDECKAVMDDIASITDPILILTGGEPLMRADIWDIIDYAHEKGLHPVVGTNGTLITDEVAAKLAEHGIPRVSISLDFPTAEQQDEFRGWEGAFETAKAGIEACNKHGVGVQVNTTITKMNNHLVDEMHDLSEELGAVAFHPFLLVPTGRGEDLVDVELTPDEYEEVLLWAFERQKTSPLHFKPTDSPQYYRIIRQQAALQGIEVTPATYGMEAMTRGCLGGITFCFISHVGDVQPCGYFDMQLGNVKEKPFSEIWTTSPVFDDLRHYDRLKGKCGACEYKGVCGGCRARALAATGDYMEEEPYCAYQPKKFVKDKVLDVIQSGFPLQPNPYQALAEQLGFKRENVLQAVEQLVNGSKVRRIGASFASKKLGYTSTLCALAVEGGQAELDRVAEIVNAFSNTTHNYARNHRYNLWFTLITRSEEETQAILDQIIQQSGHSDVLNLPATALYKIKVDFGSGTGDGPVFQPGEADLHGAPFSEHDPFDVALVRWAQGNVVLDENGALVEHPFAVAAEQTGRSEEEVLQRLRELKAQGVIRRFGAMVRHRKMGYSHNGMSVWVIDEPNQQQVGKAFAANAWVSHCYARPQRETWPFNLYAMVHATSQEELDARVAQLCEQAKAAGVENPKPQVLVSTKEYKKTSMRYFME